MTKNSYILGKSFKYIFTGTPLAQKAQTCKSTNTSTNLAAVKIVIVMDGLVLL